VAHNPEATADASYVGGGDDPVGTFLQEWTAVGGNGLRVQSIDEAHDFLKMLIEKHGVKSALCWKHPFLERGDLRRELSVSFEKSANRRGSRAPRSRSPR
jgi:hypothetical protein